MRYGLQICTIMFAMNRGMDYWVSYSICSPSSPQIKSKSMKKYWSQTTASTSRELAAITYNYFGPLQRFSSSSCMGKSDFNRWALSSTRTRRVKKLTNFFKMRNHLPNVFQCFILKNLYCAIMFGFRRSGHICKYKTVAIKCYMKETQAVNDYCVYCTTPLTCATLWYASQCSLEIILILPHPQIIPHHTFCKYL